MPRYNLSDLTLDEISLVDNGANQHAHVLLYKRDDTAVKKSLEGVKLIVGFKKDGSAEVQSVKFDKSWQPEDSKRFLKKNDLVQKDVKQFQRFRIVEPGVEMMKALSAESGFNALQCAINEALQERYPAKDRGAPSYSSYAYVRDIIGDNVIYDYDGETYRCSYTVEVDADGDPEVTLGNSVAVKLVYQDEDNQSDVGKRVPAELLFKLGKLQAGVGHLKLQINKLEKK